MQAGLAKKPMTLKDIAILSDIEALKKIGSIKRKQMQRINQ